MVGEEPFRASEAVAKGLTNRYFVRHKCRRILPDIYLAREVRLTALRRAHAVALWSRNGRDGRRRAVLAGRSAAAVWGAKWIDDDEPAACNHIDSVRSLGEVDVYRDRLAADDIRTVRDMQVTSPVRTAFDLARRLPTDEAVIKVDALYRTKLLRKRELARYAADHPGAHGIARAREVIDLSDEGADSPQETRLRLALVRAGFPRPESQLYLVFAELGFHGYIDLGWRKWRVLLDYEGDGHTERRQLDKDVDRGNAMNSAGWRWIRVRSRHLRQPGLGRLLREVRDALLAAGADPAEMPTL